MSFQGDVRGIGLAELMQGLARGRKEGILTLTSEAGLSSTVGLEGGKAYLLPDADENVERWRDRVRDAYAEDPDRRIDYLRMAEVARGQRLEDLYGLLDGGGVHFRFEPGPIPMPADRSMEAESGAGVHCDGIQIEMLLLEYARVTDELEGQTHVHGLPDYVVPAVFDPTAVGACHPSFVEQCNGTSTLQEISDRLGLPIRLGRLSLAPGLTSGGLRLTHPNQVLQLALAELPIKNFSRAAVRFTHWCYDADPGPVPTQDAERVANEWLSGRLSVSLQVMPARARRVLLRRLDHTLANPAQSAVYWLEVERFDKTDRIARLRRMASEFREGTDPERPGVRELLDLGREFREQGYPRRGAPVLVMAAHLQPANMNLQLELGTGLVAAGRPLEGAPWILAGARELLENGHADRAVGPLRTLLEKDPRNRECRQLLTRARRESSQVKKLRKNLLVGLALAAATGVGAVVKVQRDRDYHKKLEDVRAVLSNPTRARVLLQEYFGTSHNPEVRRLLEDIEERQRLAEFEKRSSWLAIYHEAQLECTRGDPLLALKRIRALPRPPVLSLIQEPWPLQRDLYQAMVDHLFEEVGALGPPQEGSPQQVRREELLDEQAEDVMVEVLAQNHMTADDQQFVQRLAEVRVEIAARRAKREALMRERVHQEHLEKQEELLQLAVAHSQNGDFPRALQAYREILALDDRGNVRNVIEPLMREVELQYQAVQTARRLASSGEHERALDLLDKSFDDPDVFMLPWKVDSYPPGVRVRHSGGRIYTTPFHIESTVGERIELRFIREGFAPRAVGIDRPGDIFVHLSRDPERSWTSSGRVDAIPVSVGEDHIVVDRLGKIGRIGPGGEVRWETGIQTLSGISRAPVFMGSRPGNLLMVTEDGAAWIVDAATGDLDGPWELGSAPSTGPAPYSGDVRVLLADGQLVTWRNRLRPWREQANARGVQVGAGSDYRYGADSGFQVARRRSGASTTLECQWNDWVVDVLGEAMVVYRQGQRDAGYSILRQGEWEYLAWESASVLARQGRLWVSDAGGLRSFVPLSVEVGESPGPGSSADPEEDAAPSGMGAEEDGDN